MVIELGPQEILILTENFPSLLFQHGFDLTYKGQIPNFGIVVIQGGILMRHENNSIKKIGPSSVIGIQNLIQKIPVKGTWSLLKNTKIIILERYQLLEAIENQTSKLNWLVSKNEVIFSLESTSHRRKKRNGTYS